LKVERKLAGTENNTYSSKLNYVTALKDPDHLMQIYIEFRAFMNTAIEVYKKQFVEKHIKVKLSV
jgi:hypothetical protein